MKKVCTYGVSLNNSSCIFDEKDDFTSLADAVEWASDRGHSYGVTIEMYENGVLCAHTHLIAEDSKSGTRFLADEFGRWIYIKKENVRNYMYKVDPEYV